MGVDGGSIGNMRWSEAIGYDDAVSGGFDAAPAW